MMEGDLRRRSSNFFFEPGASDDVVRQAVGGLGVDLPHDYLGFIRRSDGGYGDFEERDVIFWSVEELESSNLAYQASTNIPGLLLFGSNGGGEVYAFDMREQPWKIVQVPFIGMDMEAIWFVASNFSEFIRELDWNELA